jgi:hypothetical protein
MTPQQLMATGEWTRSGEWPAYSGEGPRYQHRSRDVQLQGYATHRNSRRRGTKGITNMRLWVLRVNGKPVWEDTRFSLLADAAAEYGTNLNSVTGQPLNVNELPTGEPTR